MLSVCYGNTVTAAQTKTSKKERETAVQDHVEEILFDWFLMG